jgi:hypothetical protein
MRHAHILTYAVCLGLVLAGGAKADLMLKYAQAPDLTTNGIDIKAVTPVTLADDYLCADPMPITAVHLWGSWLNDLRTDQVRFRLSFWTDIPASAGPYSMPNLEVWSRVFNPGDYAAILWSTGAEDWYDPVSGTYLNDNHTQTWQYNFLFPDDPFRQQGTHDAPIVYWLAVEATILDQTGGPYTFGWKTSIQHWNDDAVYWDPYIDTEGNGWFWKDLVYPPGHPYEGGNPYTRTNSMDLAFALTTPEPATMALLIGGVGAILIGRRYGKGR